MTHYGVDLDFFGPGIVYIPPTYQFVFPDESPDTLTERVRIIAALQQLTIHDVRIGCPPRVIAPFVHVRVARPGHTKEQGVIWPYWARHLHARIKIGNVIQDSFQVIDEWTGQFSIFHNDRLRAWIAPLDHDRCLRVDNTHAMTIGERFDVVNVATRLLRKFKNSTAVKLTLSTMHGQPYAGRDFIISDIETSLSLRASQF